MTHEFVDLGSIQWGENGLPYESACTKYKCKRCGVIFNHYYHNTPNIYEAMREVGIHPDNCMVEVKGEK